MNALRKLHDALVPGGLVIDTEPVSALPLLTAVGDPLGRLDMREWAETIRTIDDLVEQTIHHGIFDLVEERHFVITDEYDDGADFIAYVRDWAGTRVDASFAERIGAVRRPVALDQEIRLRVLRAR